MGVLGTAKEMPEGREHQTDAEGVRTYKRVYWVETDNPQDDENIVLGAPGIPARWSNYATPTSFDLKAKLQEYNVSQMSGSKTLWQVTCSYSSKTRDPQEEQDNPLNEPPEVSFSFETIQVPAYTARDPQNPTAGADWIRTAAGEAYNPPPTIDQSRLVCTITRNEPTYNVALAMQYADSVNNDVFWGAAPRTVKLRGSPTATFESKNGVNYWRVTYVLSFNELTWDLTVLNYGSIYVTSGVTKEFSTTDGVRYLSFLKANGDKYTTTTFTSTDLLRTYRVYKERPFGPLNLPVSPNR